MARLGLLCLVVLALVGSAEAQIGISPARTEFFLDDGPKTHSIRVFNLGTRRVSISVEVNNWELDEENKVRIIPPTEQSLDQWLVINPLRFTLEPGGSQAVRFAARPRLQPEPGEHRALVFFEQIPDDNMPENPDGSRILFRLGTSVIGLVEPVVRDGVIHAVTADRNTISFDIESRGNTHVRLRGQWALWPVALFPGREKTMPIEGLDEDEEATLPDGMTAAGTLSLTPVLPGTRRMVTTSIFAELDPGDYVFDLHGTVGGMDIGRTIELKVLPDEDVETEPPSGE